MTIRERIEKIKRQILDREAVLQKMMGELPVSLLTGEVRPSWDLALLIIELPYDMAILRKTRRILGSGWERTWINAFNGTSQSRIYFDYKNDAYPGVEVRLSLSTHLAGSTCQRVQVGTEVVPVYKTICH